jgi:hypothetical protein
MFLSAAKGLGAREAGGIKGEHDTGVCFSRRADLLPLGTNPACIPTQASTRLLYKFELFGHALAKSPEDFDWFDNFDYKRYSTGTRLDRGEG